MAKLMNTTVDETEVIESCKRGKQWAQSYLYQMHAPKMMGVCLRYVSDSETARDIVHDGFIKVFTKINTYTGEGSLEGWIRRIFVTTALEYLRKKDTLSLSESVETINIASNENEVGIISKLGAEDLLRCVQSLSSGYRTIFNMHAIEGFSHSEISDILGISEATSRSQFMRARNILKEKALSLGYRYETV
jgi:RNA polymerase sigma-70 factor (ECF subfamily)